MSRERLLAILVITVAAVAGIYYVAFRPLNLDGVVDHKTISGTNSGTSYTIVVFTETSSLFDDGEARALFEDSDTVTDSIAAQLDMRYDDLFYIVSVRSDGDTMGYYVSKEDFNSVNYGSRIRFNIQGSDGLEIKIKKVLD
jgi:hypothetical protein